MRIRLQGGRFPNFVFDLGRTRPSDWPQHLQYAWQIVNGTLELSDGEALSVILDSVFRGSRLRRGGELNASIK